MNNEKNNLLTICCITYNQEKYIRQTLESFVMQKTNFPFIAIVSDDGSDDNTPNIIKEFEEKYPNIIKGVYRKRNQEALENGIATFDKAKTKYVAICEGDDYWTDENKLQKQVDFLEAHPEYAGCFHPVTVRWENGEHKDSIFPSFKKMHGKKFVTKEDLLKSNYIQTNSVVYRWNFADKDIKEYYPSGILPGDWYLHLLHAQSGKIAFLNDVMAVYRKHSGGIWFDPHLKIMRFGVQIVKFYYCVWKNFADSSPKFFEKFFLKTLKSVSDEYVQYGCFDELKKLHETYGEFYDAAQKSSKKYIKKYKNLTNIFIITSVVLLILNIIQLIFNMYM